MHALLHDPARHEPLHALAWDARAAGDAIERIVRDTESRHAPDAGWPLHPRDADGGDRRPLFNLYCGAAGVAYALHALAQDGTVAPRRNWAAHVDAWLPRNRAWLAACGNARIDTASYLMGDTGLVLLSHVLSPTGEKAARLRALIERNADHPARELMWGAPGTMLAALFLHQRTQAPHWAELYRASAHALRARLAWSDEVHCHYWTQDLYGHRMSSLGGVHGFAATAAVLIAGRQLLPAAEWSGWMHDIVETVRRTADHEDGAANWRPDLYAVGAGPAKKLMQFCHGAPGIVVCLADLPSAALDEALAAGGEAIWRAGPLAKGSNLCHGTGGNGYAFLALHRRTGDARWLARARAFAMHGIAQTDADFRTHGQMRYSLWTGDLGFALYLRDCIRGAGTFPTLATFLD